MTKSKNLRAAPVEDPGFAEIVRLIESSRHQALQAVNTTLIDLYWKVGETISRRLANAEWGDGTVNQLALYLAKTQPGVRGFSRPNLFRMRQFYEAYQLDPIVSPLVRLLPWSHHLIILGQSKRQEEREFYIRMSCKRGMEQTRTGTSVHQRPIRANSAQPTKSLATGETNPPGSHQRLQGRLQHRVSWTPHGSRRGRPSSRPNQ